jgi:hypothetical protein
MISIANAIAGMFEQFYTSAVDIFKKWHITVWNVLSLVVWLAVTWTTLKLISPIVPTRLWKKIVHGTWSVMQFWAKKPVDLVRITAGKVWVPKTWLLKKVESLSWLEQKTLLKYYIFNWDIKIKKWYWWKRTRKLIKDTFQIQDDLSTKTWWQILELIEPKIEWYGNQIYKYRNNKNLKNIYMSQKVNWDASKAWKLFYKNQNRIFNFDTDALKQIKSIDKAMDVNPANAQQILKLLKNIRSINWLDALDLLADDAESLKKINNLSSKQLKKLSKELWRKWLSLDSVETIVDNIIENLSPEWKNLSKSINKQITNMQRTMPTTNKIKYQSQIDWLKEFRKKLPNLPEGDIKIYNKVFGNVEPKHFMKMLDMINELKKIDASDEAIWLVVKWFANSDVKLIDRWLGALSNVKYAEEMVEFERAFKVVEKVGEGASEIWKLFMKIVKIIT